MSWLSARDAAACGGDFVPPNEDDSPVTAHRMILSISPAATTLYDEIQFTGSASSFAWVLPIKGTATIGLSADLVFSTLDTLTETQVTTPPTNCPPPPSCGEAFGEDAPEAAGGSLAADAATATHSAVTVTQQQQVGPYETVQLHSTDPGALSAWLTQHGYAIPSAAASVISGYVAEQFDFLAMKLAPGQGVTAMRPVRVTTSGASPTLPLRMVSVGTGATTSITLWVIADGRWEPQNFPTFAITDAQIAWDWNTNASNYETLRAQEEAKYGGRGWETESSIELAQYTVTSLIVDDGAQFGEPEDATGIYLPVGDAGSADGGDASADAGAPAVDGGPETPDQVRQADLDALFAGISGQNARITRLRSDIAHSALSQDLQLQASSDQSELSNVRNPQQQIGEPLCEVYNESCEGIGTAPLSTAVALNAAMSSNGGGCSTEGKRSPSAPAGLLAGLLGIVGIGLVGRRRRRA
jgi:hypothetical protein